MQELSAGISGVKKTLVTWAKEKGLEGNRNREQKCVFLFFLLWGRGGGGGGGGGVESNK